MSTPPVIERLHRAAPVVVPSLLSSDFAHLADEIRAVEQAGASSVHVDIMDGHFVPNLSVGLPVVEAIRRCTELPVDVHLMISDPAAYVSRFRDAGADLITFHIEVVPQPVELLEQVRRSGAAAGLSLNPPTPTSSLEPYLEHCDLVLVMSVMPGFGGQEFDPVGLEKLRRLRHVGGDRLLLSVDGGVNLETAARCAAAGADLFVTGSALFSQEDYKGVFEAMDERIAAGRREPTATARTGRAGTEPRSRASATEVR